jgi:Reverse transcriptase (RNA-dependent DNA polymerase)
MKIVHELSSNQLQFASQLRSIANTVRRTAQVEPKQVGKEHRRTFQVLRSLANDRSIMITKPDKGRGVVVMDRSDYLRKMYTIIDDPATFRAIDTDTTMMNEDRLVNILRDLKKEDFISEAEYSLARPVGAMPARLYGLPKLHKKDTPLRPVMSATKTVGYGLGKVLTRRLNHLRQSPYVVKDSFDFVEKIKKSTNANKTMVSFDVKSLFTNVPLTYTIDLILDRMYPTCEAICPPRPKTRQCKDCRRRNNFSVLLRAATSDIQFIFESKTFVQHNGVAMGAPLAPVIADICMAHMETSLMEQLEQIGVCEWHRYVDDTVVLLEPDTNIEDVLHVLNEFQPSIKFTHEPEKDNTIAFLDVQVIRTW